MRWLDLLGSTLCVFLLLESACGAEYFVAPGGTPEGQGTEAAPWDIVSALGGKQSVKPGDIIWLGAGKYRCEAAYARKGNGFSVKLAGTEADPIQVRARPGERVTLDGGVTVDAPSDYVWLRDLEITVAPDVEISRETPTAGSHPEDLGAPMGGLNVYAGTDCKFINLYIHDNFGSGVGWWAGAKGGEMYGCIIVNNGWKGPDRCHGHCLYTQNQHGTKTISNCLLRTRWGQGQYTMHAYGSSRAYVDQFVIEENIAYDQGTFLVGGGRPSRDIVVRQNRLFRVPMQIGYNAPQNENCEIGFNEIFHAGLTVKRYERAVVNNNLIIGGTATFEECTSVEEHDNRFQAPGAIDPTDLTRIACYPNKYDPGRAHFAVYHKGEAAQVNLTVTGVLKAGDRFRLLDPEDLYGEPLLEGTCQGDKITVPMRDEFEAFVLVKEP